MDLSTSFVTQFSLKIVNFNLKSVFIFEKGVKIFFSKWRKRKGTGEHFDGIKNIAKLTNFPFNNILCICYIV